MNICVHGVPWAERCALCIESSGMTVSTRREALNAGRKKYFTGKRCTYGHLVQRYVSSGMCGECNRANARAYSNEMRGGQARFEVRCHPGDEAGIRAHVAAVNAARDVAEAMKWDAEAARRQAYPALVANPPPADYAPPPFTPRVVPGSDA